MIPLRDRLPTRTTPIVNYALLALNGLAFLWQTAAQEVGYEQLAVDWGFVPARFLADPITQVLTVFTAMFLHGSWLHIGGNMLFLWVFGDNVEDAIGHLRYVLFYLAGGLLAALAQLVVDPSSVVPMVGASGAIAAVLAGYVSLYPRARVLVLMPIFVIFMFFEFPHGSSCSSGLCSTCCKASVLWWEGNRVALRGSPISADFWPGCSSFVSG